MATARECAVSFLYGELERVATRDDPDDHPGEALPEREGRVDGVLGALRAVGLLEADEAEAWRLRLTRPRVERPAPSDRTRQAADELLQELLEAVPEDDGKGDDFFRFEGALFALQAVGAASGVWWERLARRRGRAPADEVRELNVGGTQQELRAVLAGPGEAVDGVRVVCALCFSDGVTVLLQFEDGADPLQEDRFGFELSDDVGTTYWRAGGGGGRRDVTVRFGTPAPAEATWLELRREGSRPIRIPL